MINSFAVPESFNSLLDMYWWYDEWSSRGRTSPPLILLDLLDFFCLFLGLRDRCLRRRRVLRLRLRLRLRRVLPEPRNARKRARVLASCAALARALALAIRARGDNADAGGMHLSSLHVLLGGQHFSIFLSPSHTAGLQCTILGTPGGGHVVPPRFLRVCLRPPRSPCKLSSR